MRDGTDAGTELVGALAAIARTVATDADLADVLARIAETARPLLPFDRLAVCWLDGPSGLQLQDLGDGTAPRSLLRSDLSPALWPDGLEADLLDDAPRRLDPAFRVDREIVEAGLCSLLRAPVGRASGVPGLLWAGSRSPGALEAAHLRVLKPIADLVSLALGHHRLQRDEGERRRRSEVLESLLPTLASVLDVREVFRQVFGIAQQVLPHDVLGLGLLTEDRLRIRMHVASAEGIADVPEFPVPDELRPTLEWDCYVAREMVLEPPSTVRARVYTGDGTQERTLTMRILPAALQLLQHHGIRSQIRVPLRLRGEIVGGLVFSAATLDRYRLEDADVARRIADHVALALSHQRLAEEERRLAEARERAVHLEGRIVRLTEELEAKGAHRVLGASKQWKDVLAQATKVAGTEATVLLTGESGTGKEVVARFIHRGSPRAQGPFTALNCAALPDQLLESELFGHEKGAFTGAVAAKPGRIEQAGGGVLFLDEVGEMSPLVQAKLLRVLQEREFQRLGATRTLKADVRVVAATNRNLQEAIARGAFREDLYYRLHVFEIRLPPLRERPEDILPFVDAFLREVGAAVGRPAAGLSRDARQRLLEYAWPGNVRELRNAVERAVILCEGSLITSEHLPMALVPAAPRPAAAADGIELPAGGVDLDALERDLVRKALERAHHNKSKAAKLLGLTRAQLYSRLEKHGLRA
jgi:transcriptional regulator with GAF, ATPase, and Fis domain